MKKTDSTVKNLQKVLGGYELTPIVNRGIRFFLRNPYESLVIVDKDGKLQYMDRGSEKFFGLAEGGAKGTHIEEFVPDSDLPKVLKTGEALIGRVLNVRGSQKISSAYPLRKDGKIIGAVGRILFDSFEEMERINKEIHRLKREVKSLKERQQQQHRAIYTFDDILGISRSIKESVEMAKKIAGIETDVFIVGESGTGKELFAQAIHNFSAPESPFIRVNCPAIPFDLAESELFGYEKGAFSGANTLGKQGKFELAQNGTIFLDEISSMSLSIQAKILRILQEREVERLGSTRIRKVKFRMITASNENLKRSVAEGKFRQDLYYRIAKATIQIPSLRERIEDIPIYVNHFLKSINKQFGTHFKRLSNDALASFMTNRWSGNVRELINVLEQASLKKWNGEEIPRYCLPDDFKTISLPQTTEKTLQFNRRVNQTEKMLILRALKQTVGNKRKAAFLLGMPRSTLYNKIKKYDIGSNDQAVKPSKNR